MFYRAALLELNENYLTGNLPITLISSGNTSVLEILDLRNNRLNGTLPAELGNLHYINKLYLSNNDFQGGLPESLGNIGKKSEKYKTIGLDGNRLSGIIPPELANISNLCKCGYCYVRFKTLSLLNKSLFNIGAYSLFYNRFIESNKQLVYW